MRISDWSSDVCSSDLPAYSGSHVANPSLFPNLGWDPVESFEPIALAVKAPHVIVVRKGLPVDSLAELIDYAKAHPGEVTFATSGIGSIQHIGTEQLARHAGVEMLHIPYRSEEHTSELQSLMRISYAVFCLKN